MGDDDGLATKQAGDVLMGGAPGAGSLLLNTKASQEAACSRAPAAIVPGQEPKSRGAGVSRFVGNGSHLAEMDAAEGHAGWVDGPGSSGNTGIGSHPAEVDAAESYAGQVGSLGSSRSAGTGSHPAEADAAEGKTVHARRFPSASVMTGGPAGPSEQDARDRPALPDPVGHVAHGQNAVWSGCP